MSNGDPRPENAEDQIDALAGELAAQWAALAPEERNPDPARPAPAGAAGAAALRGRLEALARLRARLSDHFDEVNLPGARPDDTSLAEWVRAQADGAALLAGLVGDPVQELDAWPDSPPAALTAAQADAVVAGARADPGADLAALAAAAGIAADGLAVLRDSAAAALARQSIAADAGVEVLAPVRLETRFLPPAGERTRWLMRLRVLPDEFSFDRRPPPPTSAELRALEDALNAGGRTLPLDPGAAFGELAAAVGAPRAAWLMRTVPVARIGDRLLPAATVAVDPDPAAAPKAQPPVGLPPELEVIIVPAGGVPETAATLTLDRAAIAADLDLGRFDAASLDAGTLPRLWWTSYARAKEVHLAVDVELGLTPPDLEAVIVVGVGDASPDDLLGAHAAAGRLGVLAPGTPTNTVQGEPTVEMGRTPAAWASLAAGTGLEQRAAAVFRALTGSPLPTAPLLGGELDHRGPGARLVAGLWSALWGRALRDVAGAPARVEDALAAWAARMLAPEGPYPCIRVGDQPYGLLPATALARWEVHGGDPDGEAQIRAWAASWRDLAAAAAEAAGTVDGAGAERLLALLGAHAPSRRWAARPLGAMAEVRARRALDGLPPGGPSRFDDDQASALAGVPEPGQAVGALGWPRELRFVMRPPIDRDPRPLERLVRSDSGFLVEEDQHQRYQLLGELVRETLLVARARVGLARTAPPLGAGGPLPIRLADPGQFVNLAAQGSNAALAGLAQPGAGAASRAARTRFLAQQAATLDLVAHVPQDDGAARERLAAALFATLDAASGRVDPWLVGVADRRLRTLAAVGAPFRLGAYGWVDRPLPFASDPRASLAPGPTAAGVLHAPSASQALAAALMRDGAIRQPADARWDLSLDSRKVRGAVRLAERVRSGAHPYEVLGLEIESRLPDWNVVRTLRHAFPLVDVNPDRQPCDGSAVLRAVFDAPATLPPGLPADLAETLAPVRTALETYADLLLLDGVQALVDGQGAVGGAAMEAGAGLGPPAELRALRTPRSSSRVRVSAWALLEPGHSAASDPPVLAADPATSALLEAELGDSSRWSWTVGGVSVSAASLGWAPLELMMLGRATVLALLRSAAGAPAGAAVSSTGGDERLAEGARLLALIGASDGVPLVPNPDSAGAAPPQPGGLPDAVAAALSARLVSLAARALAAAGAAPSAEALARWGVTEPGAALSADALSAAAKALASRAQAAAAVPANAGVDSIRAAIRTLVGAPQLPVVAVVERTRLPGLTRAADEAGGHPATDRTWLEVVAAVRERLQHLQARQLDPRRSPWPAGVAASDGSSDPWCHTAPGGGDATVVVAYGPGVTSAASQVGVAALDAWIDAVPSRRQATTAAFEFNGPKAQAPQAVLLAVPPDLGRRMTTEDLLATILETRLAVRARALAPGEGPHALYRVPLATPAPIVGHHIRPLDIQEHWPQ